MSKHPIAGSDKSQPEGARCLGACNPDEKIEVVVMLRRQNEDAFR
ncbi:MAG: kumamolisin, partial [Caballeronia sp.]|nr:kumamolisin [Caballeronia sp.]